MYKFLDSGGGEDVCEMDGHSLKISLWTKYRWRQNIDFEKISPSIFCQRRYYVNVDILSSPIFFCRQYFVDVDMLPDVDILSPPIFFRLQYFVDVDILSTLHLLFRGAYCSVAPTVPWCLLFHGTYCSVAPTIPWHLLFRSCAGEAVFCYTAENSHHLKA